ncbi:hypothetical protein CCHR01_12205 [Colletotrichum chrysophilum]|uniref:Uncharacterized protein n=1 Tax=Colletotrichum chrysophilum TaxID=1836956 RepID=A0AAD9AGH6_9PEZI|nr:hypothetical protein CCHR01_12205 [Colletotrichum chrysophilum]
MTPCSLPAPVRQTLEQRQRFGSLSSLLDPVRIRKQQEQCTEIPPMAANGPGLRAACPLDPDFWLAVRHRSRLLDGISVPRYGCYAAQMATGGSQQPLFSEGMKGQLYRTQRGQDTEKTRQSAETEDGETDRSGMM